MNEDLAYKDETWEELIGGKIIAMSPRPRVDHNQIAGNIYYIFRKYLRGKRCTPFADGTDLYINKNEQFIPDGMVVCDPDKIRPDGVHGAPDLVVEVLSPGTAKRDRGHKKDVYERCGVREYWIVSPMDKIIEQYVLQDGAFVLHDTLTLFPDFMLEKMKPEERESVITTFQTTIFDDLTIEIAEVFERVP